MDNDEVTTVLVPLFGSDTGERRQRRAGGSRKRNIVNESEGPASSSSGSTLLSWASEGFVRVARQERLHAAKAGALQRIVTFGCLTILLHMAHRASELNLGPRAPLLLSYLPGHTALQSASNQTYRLALRAVERLLPIGVAAVLSDKYDFSRVEDRRLFLIERLEFKDKRGRSPVYTVLLAECDTISTDSFVQGLADVIQEDNDGNTAADYWRSLGVRLGLLVPRGNRGLSKRLEPSPQVLTVLMTSLLDEDDRLPYTDFLDLLADKTGFFVGGLSSDVELLRRGSIFEATEADLAENSTAFKRHLIDAGFAREYADGVTIVSLQRIK